MGGQDLIIPTWTKGPQRDGRYGVALQEIKHRYPQKHKKHRFYNINLTFIELSKSEDFNILYFTLQNKR